MAAHSTSHLLTFLFFLAIAATATSAEVFSVEGKVYCDNCRAGFETTITEYIAGAKVRLECRSMSSNKLLHEAEGETDSNGMYRIKMAEDHEEEKCEVVLVSSPDKECEEVKDGRDRAMVQVTSNSGLTSNVVLANSLGFLRAEPLSICGELLAQYDLFD